MAGLVLMAASILLLFFIILSGVSNSTPLDKTYFLRADTKGITGAKDISQWTYFYICGDDNTDCGKARAAPPFGSAWDSQASDVPAGLGGSYGDGTTSKNMFYLWRFGWVFIIIALFFEVLAFFSGFLACCGRLGAAISFFVTSIALLCHAVASSLMTATFVMAQKKFKDDGRNASLGKYGFGFMWGSFAALLIAVGLFGAGMRGDKSPSRGGFFGRRKSTRSYEGRRVKEEYS